PESLSTINAAPGRLVIDCQPWAHVYIDSQLRNTTPLQEAILLWPGEHEIQLMHPNLPSYVQNIRIEAGQDYHLAVTLYSYLVCNIYPWGDVYLNDELLGQTPFSTLPIAPGEHVLTVKNQQYGSVTRGFAIAPGDTFFFTLNFEQKKMNSAGADE
ncbi:PEGA domain-containing protein, partial [candidate division KSB1 bacterium]